jgi:AbrB family looped-hinge helix DNA binding protein
MKNVTTSVTSKGQVTIPKEIRDLVGIRPRDRVGFRVEDGVIRIVKQRTVRDVAGTVKPLRKIDDLETMIRDAKQDHFDQRIRRR